MIRYHCAGAPLRLKSPAKPPRSTSGRLSRKNRLDLRRTRMAAHMNWLGSAPCRAEMEDALAIERPLLRLLSGDRQERVGLRRKIPQQPDHQHVLAESDAGRHYYVELTQSLSYQAREGDVRGKPIDYDCRSQCERPA